MEKLSTLIGITSNIGIIAVSMFLFEKLVKHIAHLRYPIDPEVERFRYIEKLDQDEVTRELLLMDDEDLKSLLNVLVNKSEPTKNNLLLTELVRHCINEA